MAAGRLCSATKEVVGNGSREVVFGHERSGRQWQQGGCVRPRKKWSAMAAGRLCSATKEVVGNGSREVVIGHERSGRQWQQGGCVRPRNKKT